MTPRPGHLAPVSAAARTDANGTMWRLRSLVAMGHDCARIARALHVPPELVRRVVRGQARTVTCGFRAAAASSGTPGGTRPHPSAPRPSGAPPPARCARPRPATGPPPRAWTRTSSTSPATGPGAGTGPPPGRDTAPDFPPARPRPLNTREIA